MMNSYSENAKTIAEHSGRVVDSLSSVVENRREFADSSSVFPNWFFEEVQLQCHSLRHHTDYKKMFPPLQFQDLVFHLQVPF